MKITKTNIFFLSLFTGIVITNVYNWASHRAKIIRKVDSSGIYLTDQIRASDFPQIKNLHIATIKESGFSIDDLHGELQQRIAERKTR